MARVVCDPAMTLEEKRSILVSWASDMRAVSDQPALRQLDDGRLVEIDDILDSLKLLDGLPRTPRASIRHRVSRHERGYWPRFGRLRRRRWDDDDDPPTPAPAAARPRPPVLEGGMAAAA
jgi:hypothetical protein